MLENVLGLLNGGGANRSGEQEEESGRSILSLLILLFLIYVGLKLLTSKNEELPENNP